jgi:hypothetical protein
VAPPRRRRPSEAEDPMDLISLAIALAAFAAIYVAIDVLERV